MNEGEIATIHTRNASWPLARIVGSQKDILDGSRDVFIVRHPRFNKDMQFYQQPDSYGRHFAVANASFWITAEECGD